MSQERTGSPQWPRFFSDPFSSWRMRALPRHAYSTDIDNVEVVGTKPICFYEAKAIPPDLMRAVRAGDEHETVRVDLFGRVNQWQLAVYHELSQGVAPVVVVLTDAGASRIGAFLSQETVEPFKGAILVPWKIGKALFDEPLPPARVEYRLVDAFLDPSEMAREILMMRANYSRTGNVWGYSAERIQSLVDRPPHA